MLPPFLRMRPLFVEKLWGGHRIAQLPTKAHAPASRIGESWEVADLPEGSSFVAGGPLDGQSLRDVVRSYGRALVGNTVQPGADGVLRFPLLVKLIDAHDDLSVQVHPDSAYARAHPGTYSKDEAWLLLHADAGARVLCGLKAHVTRDSFAEAVRAQRAHEALQAVDVAADDVFHITPGTVHALNRGCFLLEVQEPSDTTFRVFDYGRVDASGKPRALHIDEALAVARFGVAPPVPLRDPHARVLVQAPHFTMERLRLDSAQRAVRFHVDMRGPVVLHCTAGDARVSEGGAGKPFTRGDSVIVKAGAGDVVVAADSDSACVIAMTTGTLLA